MGMGISSGNAHMACPNITAQVLHVVSVIRKVAAAVRRLAMSAVSACDCRAAAAAAAAECGSTE